MATDYWTVSKGLANRLFNCRECKGIIYKGVPMVCRDGRKLRMHYHEECFSGEADPRTQANSSFKNGHGKFASIVSPTAPSKKGAGKWSTSYGYQPNLESMHRDATKKTTTNRGSGSSGGGRGGGGKGEVRVMESWKSPVLLKGKTTTAAGASAGVPSSASSSPPKTLPSLRTELRETRR